MEFHEVGIQRNGKEEQYSSTDLTVHLSFDHGKENWRMLVFQRISSFLALLHPIQKNRYG